MYRCQSSGRWNLFLLALWSGILTVLASVMVWPCRDKKQVESEFDFTFDFDDYVDGENDHRR